MRLLLAIAILAVVALVGARLTLLRPRLPLGLRTILLSGHEYIFLGVLLGSAGLDVLDAITLRQLEPAMLFALGWAGFLFGLQFDVRALRRLPRYYFIIATIQAVVTFAVVAAASFALLRLAAPADPTLGVAASLVLGSAACCTAPAALALLMRSHTVANRKLAALLRYISGVDGIYGLLFFSVAIAVFPNVHASELDLGETLKWLFMSLFVGLLPAVVLIALNRMRFTSQEFLVFIIGTVMFCAGLAATTSGAPLVTGLVCGVVTANYCRHRMRALTVVAHAERSIYVLLLLLIGASWSFRADYALALLGVYVLARLGGKLLGAFAGTHLFNLEYRAPRYWGLGLVPEGGLAIALIFSFSLLHHGPLVDALVTVVVCSILLSELVGARLILRVLRWGG